MSRLGWVALAVAGVAVLGLLWFLVGGYPGRDSSVFIYVADGLLRGDLPYVDRWDHKGPLIYVVNAAGRLLTPDGWFGINLLEMVSLVGCAVLGFGALRPAFGSAVAAFAIIAAGAVTAGVVGRGNSTEEWALLPQFAALYLFTRVSTRHRPDRGDVVAIVAVGALGAMAFLFRPNLIGTWLAVGVVWLMVGRWRVRRMALAIMGGVSVLTLAGAAMQAAGMADGFRDAVLTYNGVYAPDLASFAWLGRAVRSALSLPLLLAMVLAWVLAVLVLLRPHHLRRHIRTLLRWAIAAVPIEVLLVSVSHRAYGHYFLACVPVVSVLIAFVAERTVIAFRRLGLASSQSAVERRRALLISTLGVAWLTVVVASAVRPAVAYAVPTNMGLYEAAASDIKARTAPGEPVLVWGDQSLLYLLAERDSPSRYFYHVPLVTSGYATRALVESIAAELRQEPPKLIVDARMPAMPPLGSVAEVEPEPLSTYPVGLDTLAPVYEFVESFYTRGPDVGPWPAYDLNQ